MKSTQACWIGGRAHSALIAGLAVDLIIAGAQAIRRDVRTAMVRTVRDAVRPAGPIVLRPALTHANACRQLHVEGNAVGHMWFAQALRKLTKNLEHRLANANSHGLLRLMGTELTTLTNMSASQCAKQRAFSTAGAFDAEARNALFTQQLEHRRAGLVRAAALT